MLSDKRKKYLNNFNKNTYKIYTFRINKSKYANVINHLNSINSKNNYILELIIKDMKEKGLIE